MCGIAGFWRGSPLPDDSSTIARRMSAALAHRGPDADGVWVDDDAGIALAHRRLSIIDLSPLGNQPMVSARGRFVIVFNGEVFNHASIRKELLAAKPDLPSFRGHSDTEVMLAAIETWGLEAAVQRFVGMFAFALWDRQQRRLHLVRDRLGIKPLYYGWVRSSLVFGSELRALTSFPGFQAEIDRSAIALLLRHNCIPAPHSIYHGVRKLLPGTIVTLGSPEARDVSAMTYWSARDVAERGTANPFTGTDAEAIELLDSALRDAVSLRMIADVPIGAFLSGGIDSSTVVALMQVQSTQPIRTFTIGSSDSGFDESRHASAVARHLGTDHTELIVTADDALAVIPRLPTLYDEPFADSSQIPTFLVSELTRRHVTVALSGDGGDELFAGYNRHVWANRVWSGIRWMPRAMRNAQASAITAVSPRTWDALFERLGRAIPRSLRVGTPGYKLHKMAGILSAPSLEDIYTRLSSHWDSTTSVALGSEDLSGGAADPLKAARLPSFIEKMLYLDLVTYLPDDILTKVDRASMAVALEARVPIIDHRVVELAWRLPLSMKYRDGISKWILRQVLYRYVPQSLVERPKAGFGIPLYSWLRGPLREWAEALLDEKRLLREGFFDPKPIRRRWTEHLSGKRRWEYHLWDVLMFQAWLEASQSSQTPGHAAARINAEQSVG
jgi:asparagine synthase (glutamine-hydrolysing)